MSQWGKITLWDAAADGNIELVKTRLANTWSKINSQDPQGKTALMEASRWGHLVVVQFLFENGADATIPNKDGSTALHVAAQNGHDSVVDYLVKTAKVNMNAQDNQLDTPLGLAAGARKVSTVSLLLSLGADRKIKNRNQRSPADLAGNPDVAALFKEDAHPSHTKY